MNPQEQNKEKSSYQGQAGATPGVQKNESPKQPPVANVLPGAKSADKTDKDEKDATECSTTKGSCGTK